MNEKMALERRRDFGEILSDGFAFFKTHVKILSISFFKYVIPFILIGGFCYGYFFSDVLSGIGTGDIDPDFIFSNILYLLLFLLSIMVGSSLLYTTVFGVAHTDVATVDSSVGTFVETDEVGRFVGSNFIKVLVANMAMIFAAIIPPMLLVVMATVLGPLFGVLIMFLIIFVIFYLVISWVFVSYIYVTEDLGLVDSFKRSRELVSGNWWSVFGLYIVASLIASVMSMVFQLPLQIIMGIGEFGVAAENSFWTSKLALGILSTISFLGSMYANMYTVACLVMKYYDLREKKDGSGLRAQIDSFGQKKDTSFENEGEF